MSSILVINAGSATIKFAVFTLTDHEVKKTYRGLVDKITTQPTIVIKLQEKTILAEDLVIPAAADPYDHAFHTILAWLKHNGIEIIAAGHRVAHGKKFTHSMSINDEVISYLESLNPLAPLHQPYSLEGIRILRKKFPHIPQLACFDTSFHTTCNPISQLFALPQKLIQQGIRRYGFHGLSYEYIVSQFDQYLPKKKLAGKFIIAHLGSGVSMCAVAERKSVATSLSFSALDGLPMGTRCGNLDPGVLLHLMDHYKMNYAQLEKLLYKESGLLGVSGISSDMRVLLESDNEDAKLAVDLFVYKASAWIGTLTAELQGLDGLIFTAGIGENAPYIREKICERSAWLGAKIDKDKNNAGEIAIHDAASKLLIYVIPTDEEATIAKNVLAYLRKLSS